MLRPDLLLPIIEDVVELPSLLRGKVVEPEEGSILMCKIAGSLFEHTGVYIGDGKIVELAGSGRVRAVSFNKFLRDGLTRTGNRIYIACDEDNDPLWSYTVADIAKEMIGKRRDYNVIMDNCHQFTAGCITGDFENPVNFFWMLHNLIREELNYGEKIRWNICHTKGVLYKKNFFSPIML